MHFSDIVFIIIVLSQYLACASGADLEDGQHNQQVLVQNYDIGGRLYNLIYQDYQIEFSRLCSLNIIRKIYSTF